LALAALIFTLQVYDRGVEHVGIGTLYGLVLGMAMVLLFNYILCQGRSRIMQTIAIRVDIIIGRQLFDKILSLL
jgi:ATP-binding cassette subfamily C protein LapB